MTALHPSRLLAQLGSPLALPALLISLFGIVMILSASSAIALKYELSPIAFGVRQVVYLLVGVLAFLVMTNVPPGWLCKLRWWILLLVMLLLILVLFPGIGVEVNGARSWLDLGVARLQPIEFAKVALILYIAGQLRLHMPVGARLLDTIPLGALTGLAVLLIIQQPDFSGALILVLVCGGMLFMAGMAWRVSLVLLGGCGILLALPAYLAPYRLARLTAALDPWADPTGSGYQMVNAMIAIGRGGWFGVGLGKSVQKYLYLPEAHTDFLLAITIEELGLLSLFGLVALYLLLLWRIVHTARQCRRAENNFGYLCCWGVFWMLAGQSALTMGVNLAILPTTGLPLPFFSFGGSSLVASYLALGLVAACSRANQRLVPVDAPIIAPAEAGQNP